MIYTITNRSIIAAVMGKEESDIAPGAEMTVTCCSYDMRLGAFVCYGRECRTVGGNWLETFVSVLRQCTKIPVSDRRRISYVERPYTPNDQKEEILAEVHGEMVGRIGGILAKRARTLRLPMKEERPA